MIRAKHPSIVFLVETWVDEARLKEVQRNIKFDNMFYVEKNLRSGGGLALYWKIPLMFVWILSPNTTLIL